MDRGTGAANGTHAYEVDDFTAALELELITSSFATGPSFGPSGTEGAGTPFQEIHRLSDAGLEPDVGQTWREDNAFVFGPSVTGLCGQGDRLVEQQDAEAIFDNSAVFPYPATVENAAGHLIHDVDSIPVPGNQTPNMDAPPKIGTRFSSKSLRILKTWVSNNSHHPYPTTADMEMLERQTGLSRQQITNWLANTRRRNRFKVLPKRPPSPAVGSATSLPIDIQQGGALPQVFDQMNPLERWQVSPPEHEPASASAIAHAVYDYPSTDAPGNRSSTESFPTRSLYNASSASSAGTSHSSKSSINSAYSHNSRASASLDPLKSAANKRRRRRAVAQRPQKTMKGPKTLWQTTQTYQCTFCTETFKTKHNWQRHEKSLHLSLERWECSPTGPTVPDISGQLVCVFCGHGNPDDEHLEKHNYTVCKARMPEDRTFYRKDHLQQHLKLVHDAKFLRWPMADWKYESEMIRSRCGFCGLIMGSWVDRIDHLAEHFKDGKSMENWHGDWGFEDHILKMVENSMAPYMIHYERYSPWPFTTKQGVPETPPSAFELLKVELDHFANEYQQTTGLMPTNAELLYESCCVIFGCESFSFTKQPAASAHSWLRDILMSSEATVKKARVRPLKTSFKSRVTYLRINGKADIFDNCALEEQLQGYVDVSKFIESQISDEDLQQEARSIVERMEASSPNPSETFTGFLFGLINASTHWLVSFRQRAGLAPSDHSVAPTLDIGNQEFLGAAVAGFDVGTQPDSADASLEPTPGPSEPGPATDSKKPATTFFVNEENCYRRLATSLVRFVKITTSPRNPNRHIPTDAELQHQARWISFEDDDPWNQTPADNPEWLREFKREMGILEEDNNQNAN